MSQEIEQFVVIPSHADSFGAAITYLDQCICSFRNDYSVFPSEDKPPISISYTRDGQTVLVVSAHPGSALIQVQRGDARRAYRYDAYGVHHVIIDEYNDPASDVPTSSAALKETTINAAIVRDMCDYIGRATSTARS